jgi:type IV pilus assembly protein PilC
VIPRFADFFIGFASELPLPTRIVIETSQWVQHNILPLGAGLVIGLLVLRRWLATDSGRLARDRFILRLPFVGVVFHFLSLSQFIRALATLLAGGTPLVTALEVASSTVTNRHHHASLSRVALRVREGQALWSSLERTGLFSELSIAMVQVGEATGALEGMLFNASKFYDETIEIRLARVVTLIEPAVLVLMGGVIAALLLSVYMPMFSLLQRGQ